MKTNRPTVSSHLFICSVTSADSGPYWWPKWSGWEKYSRARLMSKRRPLIGSSDSQSTTSSTLLFHGTDLLKRWYTVGYSPFIFTWLPTQKYTPVWWPLKYFLFSIFNTYLLFIFYKAFKILVGCYFRKKNKIYFMLFIKFEFYVKI